MKTLRRTFYTLAERALGRLLPPAREAHVRLGRWIRRLELERERLPHPWALRQEPKHWRHLAEPRALNREKARRFSPDDPGKVFERTLMLDGHGRYGFHNPSTIFNWQGYRQAMERVGVPLPETAPDHELAPVGKAPVECHFDFEMPDFFIKNPPCPDVERAPFEVELHADDVSN